jgi:hypothetical protein
MIMCARVQDSVMTEISRLCLIDVSPMRSPCHTNSSKAPLRSRSKASPHAAAAAADPAPESAHEEVVVAVEPQELKHLLCV